jgi:hypothetical protein
LYDTIGVNRATDRHISRGGERRRIGRDFGAVTENENTEIKNNNDDKDIFEDDNSNNNDIEDFKENKE